MARVNIDILGISKLHWTGMGEFNSDDHYIYYYGQESLRRNGVCTILDAWGWCTGTTQRDGMGREEGSGWGTHVYLWQIHFDIWQN